MADPATADVRDTLNLTEIVDVDTSVYAQVLDYEWEAAKLGYAAIHWSRAHRSYFHP